MTLQVINLFIAVMISIAFEVVAKNVGNDIWSFLKSSIHFKVVQKLTHISFVKIILFKAFTCL